MSPFFAAFEFYHAGHWAVDPTGAAVNADRRLENATQDVSNAYNDFWWDRGTKVVSTGDPSGK